MEFVKKKLSNFIYNYLMIINRKDLLAYFIIFLV